MPNKYETEFRRQQVEQLLDTLLSAQRDETVANINAFRCNTRWDHQKATKAQDRRHDLYEETVKKLVELISQEEAR